MAVIGVLGNDIEIDLHRHPLTLELQMLKEPGDRTPLGNVDCFAIQCNVHDFSPKTQKAAEAAWNIGMFALPYAGITRIRY
jgi:hypothetical protein